MNSEQKQELINLIEETHGKIKMKKYNQMIYLANKIQTTDQNNRLKYSFLGKDPKTNKVFEIPIGCSSELQNMFIETTFTRN
jgi:hypothetical protein